MAVSDDTVKTNLVQIGCLELQHLVNTSAVDLVGSLEHFFVVALTTKTSCDELLAVLVQQIKCRLVCACGDFDQLGKAISDLAFWKCLQECEVQEGVHGGVVSAQTVLVVTIVDGDLNTDTGIDQANDGSGNADEVGVSSVCSTCESIVSG